MVSCSYSFSDEFQVKNFSKNYHFVSQLFYSIVKCHWMCFCFSHQEHPITYDVYLSYSVKDQTVVQTVIEMLKDKYQGIRIFSQHQRLNENVSWQDDVYEVSLFSFYLLH